ncbi:DNA mismatch repair protein MutS [Cellulosilyticum sp. WCF-2]|uniref:DNA mismatch repair protein MutS n=1 Tax=Cellulosilyticum sp. WCF-2 TaxID=2497860 RepID=UPI000F8D4EAB|nr:DNA mismatch repair protein MutS [Cellulosilyticum sp. WCF-2]QEH69423.1 DNA mismatch repair protein MutS [Cellulosilyticum sp. WCF-2]
MLKTQVTPMMAQYLTIKEENPDCLLFFRLGDFYEMFFEDAKTCSRELEITLTGKDCGLEERAPMCGVPFHSAETYISRLVEKGYKVAICEQIEDPKQAKGLVKRGVIRIVTPGTILEGATVSEGKNNYITSIVGMAGSYGLSVCDVTTGEWLTTTIIGDQSKRKLLDELAKFAPVECLLSETLYQDDEIREFMRTRFNCLTEQIPAHTLDTTLAQRILLKHFNILSLGGIGLSEDGVETLATASLLAYLQETQKTDLSHLMTLSIYNVDAFMLLDIATRRNLELTETLREKRRKGSLLWVLDHTKTAMGSRYIRKCIEQPLINAEEINHRLDATKELKEAPLLRADLFEALDHIYDIERLMSKVSFGTCNAKDMIALKQSLEVLPTIKGLLVDCQAPGLISLNRQLDDMSDLYQLVDKALIEEAPISVREGNMIKTGYNEEVDHLRQVKTEGASWLMEIEAREKEKTGIKNLKIKYNKVFGYFLEVTQSYNHLVPDYFIRKQTLSNCERYITEELKKVEEEVLGADDKLNLLEYQLFTEIRDAVLKEMPRLLTTSAQIAALDMFCSLADVADTYGYVKPEMTTGYNLCIEKGRHPVVEKMLGEQHFIANDVILEEEHAEMMLLTGPNMAGKSTYMRQVALIVLMAQIGSFVPADSATIGVVDRIFTRVGASDDLASGQSTFMVEMMEVANILHHATKNSLLILDEIGRGTSTLDGLSIAWSIIEHITTEIGAKTLFATHYHELTVLEETMPNLKNYCIAVKEIGEDIIFLHQIVKGSVDHSYGIQVAKLAGVPGAVLERAKAILKQLDSGEKQVIIPPSVQGTLGQLSEKVDKIKDVVKEQVITTEAYQINETEVTSKKASKDHKEKQNGFGQLNLFDQGEHEVITALKEADLMNTTPFKALELLYELQRKVKSL